MATNNWWADPLPPGWESKWDPGQNRYFFIDHTTKKTSWVDPRSPEGRHQVARQPAAQAYGGGGAYPMQAMSTVACSRCGINKVPANPRGQVCASCTARAAQVRCNLCDRNVVTKQGDVCTQCMLRNLVNQQETSFNNQPDEVSDEEPMALFVRADESLVTKLKSWYPKAMESHVRSALESNDNNEQKACRDLEKRGYTRVSPTEVKTDALYKKLRPKYTDCSEDILRGTITSCGCDEPKTLRKLKELGFLTYAEKQEKKKQEREAKAKRETAERNIRTEFTEVSSDMIMMALEASDFDEMNTRILLQSMISTEKAKKAEAEERAKAAERAKSAERAKAAERARASASRVVHDDTANQPSTSKSQPAMAKSKPHKATASTSPKKQLVSKGARRPPVTSQNRQQKPVRTTPVVHTSKLAHGPNHNLPKGPQDSRLLKGYCDVMGPNDNLVQGPSCHVQGSQGAYGPDATLVRGPAAANRPFITAV